MGSTDMPHGIVWDFGLIDHPVTMHYYLSRGTLVMHATIRRNFVIGLKAVHTRLATLASQASTKGILEGNLLACAEDLAHAKKALERALTRLELAGERKPRRV